MGKGVPAGAHLDQRRAAPVPVSVNVTKTDVLAMDVADFFLDMLKKYRIRPNTWRSISRSTPIWKPTAC